ncbi:hypothetical protein M011DRAFT_54206 [Sporormia fimetaria CBS 119925]|uniref:F-box domain-containing protein n=1 Tax=Sporormia fimetaria CBS 119925 TaxID=1340428 RepID=A0A6A6VC17_9PLEO|nr:hypothetical protein M011DRAFT_54206 [Sporormia fimetaria CBS 119925]
MPGAQPDLPVELILQILELTDSPTALKNAALCSKSWNTLVTPLLYRRVDITVEIDKSSEYPNGIHTLQNLTRLFLQKPDIAARVRHFSLRVAVAFRAIEITFGTWEETDEERERRLHAQHSVDALLALLLPYLRNVVTLDIGAPQQEYVSNVLDSMDQQAFPKLHSFLWVVDGCNTPPLLAPFQLPSIKSIYYCYNQGGHEWEDFDLSRAQPRSSGCTLLELRDCPLSPTALNAIIQIPVALKILVVEFQYRRFHMRTPPGPQRRCDMITALRDAIEYHKATLEVLSVIPTTHYSIRSWKTMASLRDFHKLRHLSIHSGVVFESDTATSYDWEVEAEVDPDAYKNLVDFLPPQLEVLHFAPASRYDDPAVEIVPYQGLQDLLNKRAASFPSLKRVIYDVQKYNSLDESTRLQHLSELAAQSGVAFTLRNINLFILYADVGHEEWGWDTRAGIKWRAINCDYEGSDMFGKYREDYLYLGTEDDGRGITPWARKPGINRPTSPDLADDSDQPDGHWYELGEGNIGGHD